ncbi:MAG TPA: calcium/sodium antiporter [Longimicrobiales bacterium]|nr:calcium/sodium antiporter [Longimicrobiales bacterium]
MTVNLVWLVLGLVALYYGAEWLVGGSARLARAAGITPLVIGLTVVAIGTSAPELAVSLVAALDGNSDVALGNVVGSNIANLGLILGLSAMVQPLPVDLRLIKRDLPAMVLAAIALTLLAIDDDISRLDGLFLLLGLGVYSVIMLRAARSDPVPVLQELEVFPVQAEPPVRVARDIALVLIGLALLVAGGKLLVTAAIFFARLMGVSDLVIGLTVVAIGTSLPELATSILAVARGHTDIAIGNVVGSNIMNILCILGVTATVRPLRADPGMIAFEMPIMIGISLLLVPLALRHLRIERWEGAVLLVSYLGFVVLLLQRSSGTG